MLQSKLGANAHSFLVDLHSSSILRCAIRPTEEVGDGGSVQFDSEYRANSRR